MTAAPRIDRNWSGNLRYGFSRFVEPTSIDELRGILSHADAAKAVGSRHSFNAIADTTGTHVSMAGLSARIEIDAAAKRVRVSGGMRYGELARGLDAEGWALSNLASLPHISIAGAVATGTHGSGDAVGSLASAVRGVEFVTASGDVVELREGDSRFDGAVVSLGALGVVTRLELAIEPSFDVAQTVYRGIPLDAVLDDLGAVTSSGYSTSMFTTWRDPDTIDQLWVKRRLDAPAQLPGFLTTEQEAREPVHPLEGISAESCTEQLSQPGPWLARLPHFKLEFTPSNGEELQSEYLVPRRHAIDAIQAIRSLTGLVSPLLQVCEIRTVAADGLWLSPAYDTDVIGIHFTWKPDQDAVSRALPRIEDALAGFDARPHWGKLFDLDGTVDRVAHLYPRWGDFLALREELDPRGVFVNEFLARFL
ncbi:FAD-binding protein [Microbacterium sp. SLBN-146]|uniref:FAD-binding protein n=1 Tax=Microbacterium sp. SLBN-146 TaxID=2768457 RepID=UPI0011735CC5|nr:FAD-binding protein [Microbacterium sp. SLBN-146]TQJ30774.1 xylitol oxidase [Microbacterium sp. SLBN-146]